MDVKTKKQMNRELKFRQFCSEEDNHQYGMHYRDIYKNVLIKDGDWHTMQFTDLKDKNGKEIYEGDIVSFISPNENKGIAFVEWKYGGWNVTDFEREAGSLNIYNLNQNKVEVIGNIYENQELLK